MEKLKVVWATLIEVLPLVLQMFLSVCEWMTLKSLCTSDLCCIFMYIYMYTYRGKETGSFIICAYLLLQMLKTEILYFTCTHSAQHSVSGCDSAIPSTGEQGARCTWAAAGLCAEFHWAQCKTERCLGVPDGALLVPGAAHIHRGLPSASPRMWPEVPISAITLRNYFLKCQEKYSFKIPICILCYIYSS